jgi:peptidoglycan/LPS O-acetylase OafA/YrhL
MQFYAVFPVLMLLTRKIGWIGFGVIICLAAALITRVTWHYSIHYPLPSLLPFKIDIFAVGMLLAESCRRDRRTAALYFFLALVLALEPFQGEGSQIRVAVREGLVLAFFALIHHQALPAFLGAGMGRLASLLGKNPFRWMGDVSYSVYLLHVPIMAPIIALLVSRYGHDISPFTRCAILFLAVSAIVYPLSWLTYNLIELPGQAAGRRLLRSLSKKTIDARTDRPESLAAP